MAQVSKPTVIVKYEDKDISADLTQYLSSTGYVDHIHGKEDEIELTFNDSDGLFSSTWYPDKKARVQVSIRHEGNELNCGTFFIGPITYNFSPDTVTWNCTAVDPSKELRTKKTKSYSKQSLLQIAKAIAAAHDLQVDDGTRTIITKLESTEAEQKQLMSLASRFLTYSNEPDAATFYRTISNLILELDKVNASLERKGYTDQVNKLREGIGTFLTDRTVGEEQTNRVALQNRRLGASKMSTRISEVDTELRKTPTELKRTLNLGLQKIMVEYTGQHDETDLEFLLRISNLYGLAFNVKVPYLIFYSAHHLSEAASVTTIDKSSVSSGSLTDKISETYSEVSVTSHNPAENETIENGAEIPNTSEEQSSLVLLSKTIRSAASQSEGIRSSLIRKSGETFTKTWQALERKGLTNESAALIRDYSILAAAQTPGSCTRFADFCDLLKKALIKKQASGIKVSRDKDTYGGTQSDNVLNIKVKAENKEQANAMAKAALYKKNSETRTGSITVPGSILLVAGNSFDFTGVGAMSQKYLIMSSRHDIQNGGEYTTTIEFKSGPVKYTVIKRGKNAGKVKVS